jgi:phosphoketolase
MNFDEIVTRDKPVIFAFRDYPWRVRRCACCDTNVTGAFT